MRLLILVLLQLLIVLPFTSLAAEKGQGPVIQDHLKKEVTEAQKAGVIETYGKLPLYFIENKGQVDKAVKFYERGAGHATFFTEDGVVLSLTKMDGITGPEAMRTRPGEINNRIEKNVTTEAVRLAFADALKTTKITAALPMPGHVNYFIGDDKAKWKSEIPTYGAVLYEEVYKGVDVLFYGNNSELEYDVVVRPGADFSKVIFAYRGIKGLKVTEAGELEVSLNDGKLLHKKPYVYQEINGKRVTVEGSYRILKGNDGAFEYGFEVASYDKTKELVIDPVLLYSTYLGGSSSDYGHGIAVDASDNAYVTGWSVSTDFPLLNPVQGVLLGGGDAFVTKINPAGALVYSTFIGGNSGDTGYGIAVDSLGAAYITGYTSSTDFPLVTPLMGYSGNSEAFVTKINPAGTALAYSTYLGGSGDEQGWAIAVNASGSAFITGETTSANFPGVNWFGFGALMGLQDAFVTRLYPSGDGIIYSSHLGGGSWERGLSIAVDSNDYAVVTGYTSSADFPLQDAFQGTFGGIRDVFVTRITPTGGNPLSYSSYLGGSAWQEGNGVAVDISGNAYVTGYTYSTDFPVVNAIQPANAGFQDAFVTKINPTFPPAIVYSTYLGGSNDDYGKAIAVDAVGNVVVTGYTGSYDFPVLNAVQGTRAGGSDAFITKIDAAGAAILESTYLGGSGHDYGRGVALSPATGSIYITGETRSVNFPLVNPIQGTRGGISDVFISKISGTPLPVVYLAIAPDAVSVARGSVLGYNATATNTTATQQCFQYWENVTLPNGLKYPPTGKLFGPVNLCLNTLEIKNVHLTHGIPMVAPVGAYVFNAFVGTHPTPLLSEAHFNFDVTALGPLTNQPQTSWRLIENGFRK